MIGTYLVDMFKHIVDAAFLADLNVELSAQDLEEITGIGDMFVKRNLIPRPYCLVNLTSPKDTRVASQDYSVVENVPMDFEVYITGDQINALMYEGVFKAFIKGKEGELRNAISDCQLVVLHLTRSTMEQDDTVRNADGWKLSVRFTAVFSWD